MTDKIKTEILERTTVAGQSYRRIEVHYGLRAFDHQAPYFAVTADVWDTRYRAGDPDSAGQNHEIVSAVFPHLRDMIALHMSNIDGVPMHAIENGWFWFSDFDGGFTPSTWRELSPAQRAEDYLRAPAGYFDGVVTKDEFVAKIDELRPVWKAEADAAIARHGLFDLKTD
jgi:hypothetical protein